MSESTRTLHVEWVGGVALLTGGLLLACLLVEGIARVFFPEWGPRTAQLTNFWKFDEVYGWSHTPGIQGVFPMDGRDSKVSINARGFRGPEIPYERSPGRKRAVVLGDSFVWGFGVDYEDTFLAGLGRQFPNVDVIGLGVSGYSTDQELILYRNEGRKYQADLVIVVIAANDLSGNTSIEEYLIYSKPAFVIGEGGLLPVNQPAMRTSLVKRLGVQLAWRSYVLTGLQRYLYERKVAETLAHQSSQTLGKKEDEGEIRSETESRKFLKSASWQITIRLLQQFKEEVDREGSDLLVVFVEGVHPSRDVASYLRKFQIESVVMENYIGQTDLSAHLSDGLHWSPNGHRVVAEVIGNWLVSSRLLTNEPFPPIP